MTAAVAEQPAQRCLRSFGRIYYGELREQQENDGELLLPHGQGHQILTAVTVAGESFAREVYKGAFSSGLMSGAGTYRWSDGTVYEGSFQDGKMSGTGRLTWPEGSFYNGTWVHGEMTGQGTFYSAFLKITRQGFFHRNCLKQHNGQWLDVAKEREQHRSAQLLIGGGVATLEAEVPIFHCVPEDLAARLEEVRRDPHYLVPLILADANLSEGGSGARSPAPLWCLESTERGCIPPTTVHLAFVAAEKRRKRDYQKIFREAICEALLAYRYFALVFGEGGSSGNERADSIGDFLDPSSLPPDLFDLRHFHGAGGVDAFLPADRVATSGPVAGLAMPGGASGAAPAAPAVAADGADASGAGAEADGSVATVAPVAYLLQFAMVSLRRLDKSASEDDNELRRWLSRRFAELVPLHRVGVIVVSAPR
eukprot:TRINITY_DN17867_c0_g3_i1.p1 TRINITY_DN17867_c0_g3~~TRINITY_DN17867_c0_g3_i1.p1  ORF type:complete len:453 (+),score=88.60 TRINITY_DN17867_c0_g3_i1:90-1361(+)